MIYLSAVYLVVLGTVFIVSLVQLHHIYAQSKDLLNVSDKYLNSKMRMISKELLRLFNVLMHFLVYISVVSLHLDNTKTLGLIFLMYFTLFVSYEYRLVKKRKKAFTYKRVLLYIKTQYRFIKKILKKDYYTKHESKLMENTEFHKIIKTLTGENILLYYITDKRSFVFVRKNTKEGIKIYFNEDYLQKLTRDEVIAILLHEVGHKKNKSFLNEKWFRRAKLILSVSLLEIIIITLGESYLACFMAFELILFLNFRAAIIISHIEENLADAYSKKLCKSMEFFNQTLSKSYQMIKDGPESCLIHNLMYERHPLIKKRVQNI